VASEFDIPNTPALRAAQILPFVARVVSMMRPGRIGKARPAGMSCRHGRLRSPWWVVGPSAQHRTAAALGRVVVRFDLRLERKGAAPTTAPKEEGGRSLPSE
jgi:hypothetical protein